MAAIVRELLAGGPARLADDRWLKLRSEATDLGAEASGALETLRARLVAGGTTLLRASSFLQW
jgi:hypothetical protein